MITYAIGDIHGRLDLLEKALEMIKHHRADKECKIVFLGDYVDRGDDSAGVVERLIQLSVDPNITCLRGNHEQLMIDATTDKGGDFFHWCRSGGLETMNSYGYPTLNSMWGNIGFGPKEMRDDLVIMNHIAWLKSLPCKVEDEHRFFVHAGIDPYETMDMQDEFTMMWIRDKFLRASPEQFVFCKKHVVHGHTPNWGGQPDLLPNRTNLDAGAYETGRMPIGVFDDDFPGGPVEILSVVGEAREYT